MKKETAVDYLFKAIYGETGHIDAYTTEGTPAYDAYRRAKLIEEKAIFQGFADGQKNGYQAANKIDVLQDALDYYKNKYLLEE